MMGIFALAFFAIIIAGGEVKGETGSELQAFVFMIFAVGALIFFGGRGATQVTKAVNDNETITSIDNSINSVLFANHMREYNKEFGDYFEDGDDDPEYLEMDHGPNVVDGGMVGTDEDHANSFFSFLWD